VKSSTNNPGIVWLPYTIQALAATWSGTPNLSKSITSRYSTVIIEAKNEKRKRKIKNILKENHSI
jgi:hypothetical protein